MGPNQTSTNQIVYAKLASNKIGMYQAAGETQLGHGALSSRRARSLEKGLSSDSVCSTSSLRMPMPLSTREMQTLRLSMLKIVL